MISGKNGSVGATFGNREIDRLARIIFFGLKYVLLAFAMGGAGNWAAHVSLEKLNFLVGYIVEPWSTHGYLQEPISNLSFGFAGALAGVLVATILCMAWKHVLFLMLMSLVIFAFREFSLFGGVGAMFAPDFWLYGQFAMAFGAACAFVPALGCCRSIGYMRRRWRNSQSTTPPGTGRAA